MAKVKAKVTTKIKKKFWFPIIGPKVFNNRQLGEIYLTRIEQAIGRVMWYPLKEITESMRDQSVCLKFLIKNASGNTLNTELIGYKMVPNSLKRMVRRRNDRSDDSFVIETSDGKKVRLKTLILTAHNTKNSISTKLKKAMIEKVTVDIKKINFGNLIDKLIAHKIQMEMKKFLTKMYPVKAFAVKFMGLEKERGYGKDQEEALVEGVVEVKVETPKEAVKEGKVETAPEETREGKEPSVSQKPNVSEKKETVKEAVKEAEEKAAEKAVEKVVEKEADVPEKKAEKAAEELVEAQSGKASGAPEGEKKVEAVKEKAEVKE
ncbi:MAG: hypothetical protein KAT77_03125 [Nanoarchaeota archaeon]|nr:hypothetical protein [Nanoarchaeota archaeon]